jgi:hypothetical protein
MTDICWIAEFTKERKTEKTLSPGYLKNKKSTKAKTFVLIYSFKKPYVMRIQ